MFDRVEVIGPWDGWVSMLFEQRVAPARLIGCVTPNSLCAGYSGELPVQHDVKKLEFETTEGSIYEID